MKIKLYRIDFDIISKFTFFKIENTWQSYRLTEYYINFLFFEFRIWFKKIF